MGPDRGVKPSADFNIFYIASMPPLGGFRPDAGSENYSPSCGGRYIPFGRIVFYPENGSRLGGRLRFCPQGGDPSLILNSWQGGKFGYTIARFLVRPRPGRGRQPQRSVQGINHE
jgi:hypothetical protein